jgi:hypothetical protein
MAMGATGLGERDMIGVEREEERGQEEDTVLMLRS